MQYVDLFKSDYLFDGPMRPKIAEWWDLQAIDEQFGEFLALYDGAGEVWSGLVGDNPEAAVAESTAELRRYAFQFYVPMLTVWRRFPYRDPNLPLEYLPENWRGPLVRQTFQAVHRLAAPLAAAYAEEIIHGRDRLVTH
jgi:phenylacetic acid degradation operon negative regulatory protein